VPSSSGEYHKAGVGVLLCSPFGEWRTHPVHHDFTSSSMLSHHPSGPAFFVLWK
jgi:hypothetical protein